MGRGADVNNTSTNVPQGDPRRPESARPPSRLSMFWRTFLSFLLDFRRINPRWIAARVITFGGLIAVEVFWWYSACRIDVNGVLVHPSLREFTIAAHAFVGAIVSILSFVAFMIWLWDAPMERR